jgi:hypothetical protein
VGTCEEGGRGSVEEAVVTNADGVILPPWGDDPLSDFMS